jgi:hypothetical protein
MVKYLISNQPSSSFVQINTIYTNMEVSKGDGLAYGFLSSKVKMQPHPMLSIDRPSEDSLIMGVNTRHLSFRPWTEYKH